MKYVKTYESFLNEEKSIPGVLYHFSSPWAILSILETDKIFAGNLDCDFEGGRSKLSISFTRDVNFWKKGISGFKPVKKGAYIAVDSKKIQNDGIALSDYVFKSNRDFDYSKEDEVRAYTSNGMPVKKYLIEVGLTKHSVKEQIYADKLKEYCKDSDIKIVEVK